MGMEELRRELQNINFDEFVSAFGRVYERQAAKGDAVDMIEGLFAEYPTIAQSGILAAVAAQQLGASQEVMDASTTAALAPLLALKDMIQVSQLDGIPTREF